MQGVIQEPAGFMPTRDEYAKAQRVADNLAAQLAQARAENDRLSAEVARPKAALYRLRGEGERLIALSRCKCAGYPHVPPCDAQEWVDDFMRVSDSILRGDQAPARCVCGHTPALHDAHGYCGECACDTFTAPAGGEARP